MRDLTILKQNMCAFYYFQPERVLDFYNDNGRVLNDPDVLPYTIHTVKSSIRFFTL